MKLNTSWTFTLSYSVFYDVSPVPHHYLTSSFSLSTPVSLCFFSRFYKALRSHWFAHDKMALNPLLQGSECLFLQTDISDKWDPDVPWWNEDRCEWMEFSDKEKKDWVFIPGFWKKCPLYMITSLNVLFLLILLHCLLLTASFPFFFILLWLLRLARWLLKGAHIIRWGMQPLCTFCSWGLWSYMVFSCVDCCFHCWVTAELWRAGHSSSGLLPESGTVCTSSQTIQAFK